jgi:hypothetical protein
MTLTAAQVQRILSFRGQLRRGIPAEVPTPTERRLQLDRVLARGGRLGDPGRHSG